LAVRAVVYANDAAADAYGVDGYVHGVVAFSSSRKTTFGFSSNMEI
jgi:hypothetical protein